MRLLALIVLPMMTLLGAVAVGPSATAQPTNVSCYGDYCSGLDPAASGCAADAYTVASHAQENGGGIIEIRWSPTCQTNWARWTQYPTGWCLNCGIVGIRAVQDTGYTQSLELINGVPEGNTVWTGMIYSPVHKVKAEAMNPCGGATLIDAAFDCATSGWESTIFV